MSISTNFNWDDYIKDTNSVAAPRACFKQSKIIPKNEFAINMNLEVEDPRNLKTLCIATVKSIVGCRIRLRLNGTDNSNDFYRLGNCYCYVFLSFFNIDKENLDLKKYFKIGLQYQSRLFESI